MPAMCALVSADSRSVPKRALGANLCGLAEVQTQEGERGGCTYLESSSDWRALGLRAAASRCFMLCRARPTRPIELMPTIHCRSPEFRSPHTLAPTRAPSDLHQRGRPVPEPRTPAPRPLSESGRGAPNADRSELADTGNAVVGQEPAPTAGVAQLSYLVKQPDLGAAPETHCGSDCQPAQAAATQPGPGAQRRARIEVPDGWIEGPVTTPTGLS